MIWYLNVMTATAQAAMPLAPQLRITLLNQTRLVACSACHSVRSVCDTAYDDTDDAESEGDDVEWDSDSDIEAM